MCAIDHPFSDSQSGISPLIKSLSIMLSSAGKSLFNQRLLRFPFDYEGEIL
jgi:hypothetical protein